MATKPPVMVDVEDAVVVSETPPEQVPANATPAPERVDLVLLGVHIGTYAGWGNGNETTLIFHNYQSSVGLPDGLLGYDSLAGEFRYYNEAGEPTLSLSVVKVLHQIVTGIEAPAPVEDAVVVAETPPPAPERNLERVVAAAIQWDGVTISLPQPSRHGQVMGSVEGFLNETQIAYATQGFVTSEGRFVNRVQALQIANLAKQIIEKTGGDRQLFSEDIW